jgi:hypothetical protein
MPAHFDRLRQRLNDPILTVLIIRWREPSRRWYLRQYCQGWQPPLWSRAHRRRADVPRRPPPCRRDLTKGQKAMGVALVSGTWLPSTTKATNTR